MSMTHSTDVDMFQHIMSDEHRNDELPLFADAVDTCDDGTCDVCAAARREDTELGDMAEMADWRGRR